jgi:hypothetical protein
VAAPNIQVLVDRQPVAFDQAPVMQQGRVLVPLRGVFESLGAEVNYMAPTHTIQAVRGTTRVELPLGGRTAIIDGRQAVLDVPAMTVGGRTMVPLRFVSEALGATVDWQAATQTVAITAGQPVSVTTTPVAIEPVVEKLSIDSVVHSATGPLTAGDRLQVTMTGDAGGQADFDLMGVQTSIPMREVRPGRYEGTVNIPNGVTLNEANVVAHLTSNSGQETMKEASKSVAFGSSEPIALEPQYVSGKLEIWNLKGGMNVDKHFYVEGRTVPNGKIHVVAHPQGDPNRIVEASGVSNPDGYFKLDLDASTVPGNTLVDTTVHVTDQNGQMIQPSTITLKIEE